MPSQTFRLKGSAESKINFLALHSKKKSFELQTLKSSLKSQKSRLKINLEISKSNPKFRSWKVHKLSNHFSLSIEVFRRRVKLLPIGTFYIVQQRRIDIALTNPFWASSLASLSDSSIERLRLNDVVLAPNTAAIATVATVAGNSLEWIIRMNNYYSSVITAVERWLKRTIWMFTIWMFTKAPTLWSKR